VVGSLGTKREALAQQIEALEQFDREYRSRLTAFMQGQLRSLWVDQPQVAGNLPEQPLVQQITAPSVARSEAIESPVAEADSSLAEAPVSGPRHGSDEVEDAVPAQRQSPEEDDIDDEEELSER
jgi:hypothetical protein